MHSFPMELSRIQPSQLYISEEKLLAARANLAETDWQLVEPLPVKQIGDLIFFTDGHTRAFALLEQGITTVEVYWDRDELDWLSYLICINWCLEEKITEISQLKVRVVDADAYESLWHDRCAALQQEVKEGIYEGLCLREVNNPAEKASICSKILHALPDWFGIEAAKRDYIAGVEHTLYYAVQIGRVPIGFISLVEHNECSAEIYVLGIFAELHRRGLGRRLLGMAEKRLKLEGKKFLCVKTLGDSFQDRAYVKTKMFYRSMGFFPLFESEAIWGSGCPCLIMVKTLE